MALFTPEELEELRRADAELDEEFVQTQEEIEESRKRDKQALLDRLDAKGKKIAENQRAYYEANREKIAENQRAWVDKTVINGMPISGNTAGRRGPLLHEKEKTYHLLRSADPYTDGGQRHEPQGSCPGG